MGETHDYLTETVSNRDLDETHVLVGECGGLSAVFGVTILKGAFTGMVKVNTEHGVLLLYVDHTSEVIADA